VRVSSRFVDVSRVRKRCHKMEGAELLKGHWRLQEQLPRNCFAAFTSMSPARDCKPLRASVLKLFTPLLFLLLMPPAYSASLQVEPVLVDVVAPGATSSVTLRNDGKSEITAQVRVYRWSQNQGQEILEPTEEVVASPAAVTLGAGRLNIVRIVRVRKDAVIGEESYRLFIDQLPQAAEGRAGLVSLVVRHSIPVFFRSGTLSPPSVSWSAHANKGKITVTARNDGQRRLRIARLQVRDNRGSVVKFGDGLVGYALGKSTMRWSTSFTSQRLLGERLTVSAQSDIGAVDAVAMHKPAP
jgi:fimbrial chaperone protein